ncbi:MAG: alcohol dehydrogenase catalytic domain-containing protein [Pseudomonadota bacterium]
MEKLQQSQPGEVLTIWPLEKSDLADGVDLEVLACAPTIWDIYPERTPGTIWPRIPGGAIVGQAPEKQLFAASSLLPCGTCECCKASLHLACTSPYRPGSNAPGGFANSTRLPDSFLVPDLPLDIDPAIMAALIALAGPTYQTIATVGMVPGDTVVVWGQAGPGALPLQLLRALGMRPIWVTSTKSHPIDDIQYTDHCPTLAELPNPRCHVIDLSVDEEACRNWLPLAANSISCTVVGSMPSANDSLKWQFQPVLENLLFGQAALRWIRDIHPHLVLELIALVKKGWVTIDPWVQRVTLEKMPKTFATLLENKFDIPKWPVFSVQT